MSVPLIAYPTPVLAGRKDALTPLDRQLELAQEIPGATLGCSHAAVIWP